MYVTYQPKQNLGVLKNYYITNERKQKDILIYAISSLKSKDNDKSLNEVAVSNSELRNITFSFLKKYLMQKPVTQNVEIPHDFTVEVLYYVPCSFGEENCLFGFTNLTLIVVGYFHPLFMWGKGTQ